MMRQMSLIAAVCVAVACCDSLSLAQTLWTEDAENGLANVLDHTDASYSLIQSDVVGQGNFAFHLANPDFNDNWFGLDTTISVAADTKLFFLSQLSWATTSQVAKVQLSTNGGSTWPNTIFEQAGTGGAGESTFSLKQVVLGAYANQDVRLRFLYDFTSGSAFTQTDSGVGWHIDDIQIGSELQKSQWSIGNPTAYEQQYLEFINRARADAIAEAHRLAGETDPDITSAYSYYGITDQNIVDQFEWYVDNGLIDRHAQPLSFNAALLTAAQLHTQDMFQNEFQGHTSSSNPPDPFPANASLGQRLDAVGYDGAAGENVYSYADSVAHGHAGFVIDWGNVSSPGSPGYNPAFEGQGMQNPAGHRRNIHNGDFSEVGIGVVNGTNGSVGPQLVTQDFGIRGDVRYITGAVYEDLNGNNFYDIGEGRGGVRIDVDGAAYFAISTDSGGYSIPVPEDGEYEVIFSGGSFATYSTLATVSNGWNVKVDYLVSPLVEGDINGDGLVDARDYVAWRNTMSDDIGQYILWKENYGGGAGLTGMARVPEPSAVLLLALVLPAACLRWRKGRQR
jgi:hypothetical protein